MSDALEVTESVSIPRDELSIRVSRSGGAGGQHVNTSSTRVELLWNVGATRAIPEGVLEGVQQRLRSRTNAEGVVRIVSSEHRSQLRNREAEDQRRAQGDGAPPAGPLARQNTAAERES